MWSVGTLTNGAQATLNLYLTPTSSVAGKTVTDINLKGQSEGSSTSPATANLTVDVPLANVQLTLASSNNKPDLGIKYYYTITVTNNGPNTANSVTVTDQYHQV